MSFWDTTHIQKARKDHDCQYCQMKIKKGTSYYKEVGVVDGDFNAYKIHPECKFEVAETFERGDCFSPFKVPRSNVILFALRNGSEALKKEVRKNLLIEFPDWEEKDIVNFDKAVQA